MSENGGDDDVPKKKAEPVNAEINGREVDFKNISIEEALQILEVSEQGLSSEEAKARLAHYGPNKLPESRQSPILKFLGYMWNPLSWAMEAAAIIAIALLDWADFALILALLLLNATISFVEESSADAAIKALAAALAPKAKVLRDGKLVTLEALNLVPGDVVLVRLGDIVPADVKLIGEQGEHDQPLQVDQAALTGESLPVKKVPGDVAFSGSAIKQGEKHAVVYATGASTFFGRAAALISGVHNVANIQKIMTRIGACCLITIGVWVVIELAVQFGHYRHRCKGGEDGCPTLLNMLVIVVGGIPIAMPTVLSVTLALGASALAKEGAIVARMSAVEEMAGTNILCSDKTGTLTLNKLTINNDAIYALGNYSIDEILKHAALSANLAGEEPIDVVMHNCYPGKDTLWQEYTALHRVPFNPVDKYTIAIVADNRTGRAFRVMKGAPQVVLRKAHNSAAISGEVRAKINEFASRGFRALGLAVADSDTGEGKWDMMAVVPMYDPPRHDTKQTIEDCIEKGIAVKMVTGDQLLIGIETAKQLGMGTNMYTTEELLKKDSHTAEKPVEAFVEEADGFAEVFPEHKYKIVELLKSRGHTVAMTGDGVNDAPALKKADVGIAVAGATDAARGAADIVLTEPGLSTIVTAVIGARKIFQRMTTYAKYTVAMTFRICFTFGLLTTIYNWYFPTLLIVLLAVFNDGAMIALSKDRVTPSRTPNRWDLPAIFGQGIVYGLYLTFSTWLLYFIATKTQFFPGSIKMFSLNDQYATLANWCHDSIASQHLDPAASACTAGPQYYRAILGRFKTCAQPRAPTVLDQCRWEQYYVRNSMTRSLIYNYVSVSGQALVFVVRTQGYSLLSRAGLWTYIAFFGAQLASTLIAIFGFGGYTWPRYKVEPCLFCRLSTGGHIPFYEHKAPIAFTESGSTDSTIGCTYYVIVAWIWAFMFYLGLDPLKWLMAYLGNEDGVRDRYSYHKKTRKPVDPAAVAKEEEDARTQDSVGPSHMLGSTYDNPLGRASMARPTPVQLQRASVVTLAPMAEQPRGSNGSVGGVRLGRVSAIPSSSP